LYALNIIRVNKLRRMR